MNTRLITTVSAIGALMILGVTAIFIRSNHSLNELEKVAVADSASQEIKQVIEITPNSTYGELLKTNAVPDADIAETLAASKSVYDLALIRAGKSIDIFRNPETQVVNKIVYQVSVDDELHLTRTDGVWTAALIPISYDIRLKRASGTVTTSLYESGLAQNLDERAIIALADVFQWTVDFAQDVRVSDSYSFTYEELWRDGTYIMPGRVMVAEYVNDGENNRAYLFKTSKGEESHFDAEGSSLRKMFLKAPVAFKYVSSGFTTGRRYVSAFDVSTGHRAIDYAAKSGTPIRATANGTVVQAGRNGPYGNFVSIRHNGTYTTNYAHQSKIAVKKGQRVTQGQIIGYVGSTGFSTGPHLHYEMVKHGKKINPLREKFPSTDPIPETDRAAFQAAVIQADRQFAIID